MPRDRLAELQGAAKIGTPMTEEEELKPLREEEKRKKKTEEGKKQMEEEDAFYTRIASVIQQISQVQENTKQIKRLQKDLLLVRKTKKMCWKVPQSEKLQLVSWGS